MKALSLWQPWASLLVTGHKRVETRAWPIRHRGPLLIHASKHWDAEVRALCREEPFRSAIDALGLAGGPDRGLPLGSILGRVNVIDCFPTDLVSATGGGVPEAEVLGGDAAPRRGLLIGQVERAFGDYSPGRFAFLCNNPVRFADPVPLKGLMGVFDVPDDLVPEEYRR